MVVSTLWAGFILASVFPRAAQAGDCSIKPLVLPIRNVTFPDGIGANRGIKLVLGSQIQGMRMSTIVNNTRVRNILDCPTNNSSSLVGCEGSSGSVYSTTAGTFDQVFNLKDWNVTVIDPQPDNGATTVVQGYDVANFTDGPAVISNYPIEVWADHNALNMSALALGPKSSTLERFVDNGLAPSTSFSIDFGSRSELYPRDGQVIFGGINEARFSDDVKAEFPLWGAGASVNCPLQVLISDVILTNADGNHSLFDDADSKVSACIDTIQNAFTFTPSMVTKFQTLGNHIGFDGSTYSPQSYPADSEPLLGSLTIRLANGYESVIPHYELISHERGTNSQGKFAVVNNSRIQAAVAFGASDLGNNVPILGGVFLSQNYLHVDYEAGKFWLSPQVANGTLEDRITTTCTGSSTNSTTGQKSGTRNLALKISLPIVACCAALALLGAWLFLRNRKRGGVNQSAGAASRNIKQDPSSRPDSKSSTSRLGGYDSHRPTELEGDRWPVPEIHGKELQEENPAYATYFTESPRIKKQDPYYGFPQEGEAYELPDTSPAPCRLSNRGIDSHQISRNDTLQTEVSEASHLNSAKVIPSPISQISSI